MITLAISVAAVAIVGLLLAMVGRESRRNRRQDTWICASCLYACSNYEDALTHVHAVHPRTVSESGR